MTVAAHVLILGGCGRVGGVLAHGLRATGERVTVTARDELEAKSCASNGLAFEIVDFDDAVASAEFARRLPELHLDHAVLSFAANYAEAPLLDFDPEEVARLVAGQVSAQLRVVQRVLPALGRSGTLVWINGGSAHTPQKNRGVSNLVAAATWMLQRCLREESKTAARVVSLLLEGAVGSAPLPAEVRIDELALVDACRRLFANCGGISYALAPGSALRQVLPPNEAADLEELA